MPININKIPESNIEWAAQQIADHFTKDQLNSLQSSFQLLDGILYKSWANELTLSDLKQAIEMALPEELILLKVDNEATTSLANFLKVNSAPDVEPLLLLDIETIKNMQKGEVEYIGHAYVRVERIQ